MRGATSIRSALVGMAMTFALASAAHASSPRSWVSFSGDDAHAATNCTRALPCRTLAGAFPVTSAGGYGPITITRALTITGVEGAVVSVASSTIGITINAAASDVVTLRNLLISGAGGTNTIGIQLNTGRLVVQNSSIRSLTTGLSVNSAKADVTDTDFIGNGVAIATTGQGIDTNVSPLEGATSVRISNGNVLNNGTAYQMNNPGVGATCPTCNRFSISARNSSAGITVNQGGNTNIALGTGASCAPTVPSGCTSINSYSVTGNQQGP
jgi:hypothetical protein